MIRPLKRTDLLNFIYFCQKRDSDFYITRNNRRLYLTNLKIAKSVFNDCMKHGEKCFIKENNNQIIGIMLITGFKDNFDRKYLKILANNKDDSRDLFRFLIWEKIKNLFIKTRKNNIHFIKYDERLKNTRTQGFKPSYFARKSGFRIIVVREKEVLLKKEDYNTRNKNRN